MPVPSFVSLICLSTRYSACLSCLSLRLSRTIGGVLLPAPLSLFVPLFFPAALVAPFNFSPRFWLVCAPFAVLSSFLSNHMCLPACLHSVFSPFACRFVGYGLLSLSPLFTTLVLYFWNLSPSLGVIFNLTLAISRPAGSEDNGSHRIVAPIVSYCLLACLLVVAWLLVGFDRVELSIPSLCLHFGLDGQLVGGMSRCFV